MICFVDAGWNHRWSIRHVSLGFGGPQAMSHLTTLVHDANCCQIVIKYWMISMAHRGSKIVCQPWESLWVCVCVGGGGGGGGGGGWRKLHSHNCVIITMVRVYSCINNISADKKNGNRPNHRGHIPLPPVAHPPPPPMAHIRCSPQPDMSQASSSSSKVYL